MNGEAEFYVPQFPDAPGSTPGAPTFVTLAPTVSSAAQAILANCRYRMTCTAAFSLRAGVADPGAALVATDMGFPANTVLEFWSGANLFLRAVSTPGGSWTFYRLSR